MLSAKEHVDIIHIGLSLGLLEIVSHECKFCGKIKHREYKWLGDNLLVKGAEAKKKGIDLVI